MSFYMTSTCTIPIVSFGRIKEKEGIEERKLVECLAIAGYVPHGNGIDFFFFFFLFLHL